MKKSGAEQEKKKAPDKGEAFKPNQGPTIARAGT